MSSADWHQQMASQPTFFPILDPRSNSLHNNTSSVRFIPLIDDYTPYYPDSDYGFDPYWDANSYNQNHLYFYNNYNKSDQDVEPNSYGKDQALNTVLANARVD